MLVTDRLIYVEMPKTGCTYISGVLERLLGGRYWGKGATLRRLGTEEDIRTQVGTRLILSSIRNPLDWYISLWSYGATPVPHAKWGRGTLFYHTVGSPVFVNDYLVRENLTRGVGYFWTVMRRALRLHYKKRRLYRARRERAVRAAWWQIYKDPTNPEAFRQWLKMIFDPKWRAGLPRNYQEFLNGPLGEDCGLMTHHLIGSATVMPQKEVNRSTRGKIGRVRKLLDENMLVDWFVRQERLNDDLCAGLDRAGVRFDDAKRENLLQAQPVNVSKRIKSIDFYYDDETYELVRRREQVVFDMFGYD